MLETKMFKTSDQPIILGLRIKNHWKKKKNHDPDLKSIAPAYFIPIPTCYLATSYCFMYASDGDIYCHANRKTAAHALLGGCIIRGRCMHPNRTLYLRRFVLLWKD